MISQATIYKMWKER